VPILRNGRLEEVYWTYGYSPVFDDHGQIGPTLVVCTGTTSRVIAERLRGVQGIERERGIIERRSRLQATPLPRRRRRSITAAPQVDVAC
jgi:hypothetical protein